MKTQAEQDAEWEVELARRAREFPAPAIEIGSLEGRERWYRTTHHIDELKQIAYTLVHGEEPWQGFRPGLKDRVSNFKLWYDREHDYHRLSFDLDGCRYVVRYYKIFTIEKEGVKDPLYLNHNHNNVTDMFLGKNEAGEWGRRHLQWTNERGPWNREKAL